MLAGMKRMSPQTPRELFEAYASAVAYCAVRSADGTESIGTAFHVGEGVFLTARHVVESKTILKFATTTDRYVADPNGSTTFAGRKGRFELIPSGVGRVLRGPLFHPDDRVDVAAFVVDGLNPPAIPLGSHLDDWLNDEAFLLREVVVLGYPPIPFSREPKLIATRAEVNAVIDKYNGPHPHFIISAMARGGFSGGPCLIQWNFGLGLVTESLGANHQPAELGYLAVISVEPLFVCMQHHGIVPAVQKKGWDGLWD